MASERDNPTPAEQVARLYEQAETQAAKASESFVGSQGFAWLLGRSAENMAALIKLSADGMDLVLRNLRLAGRRDVVRLARQLARTEDKLERVLQELEALRDELKPAGERHGHFAGNGRHDPHGHEHDHGRDHEHGHPQAHGHAPPPEHEGAASESEELGHA